MPVAVEADFEKFIATHAHFRIGGRGQMSLDIGWRPLLLSASILTPAECLKVPARTGSNRLRTQAL